MTGPASPPPNFDGLARIYRGLEFLAFGRDLERARTCYADRLADCRAILVLGEGDGRYLARLVQAAPLAQIHCIDASGAMLARAAARLVDPAARERVRFEGGDAFAVPLPAAHYDAVATLFFLDCFPPGQVEVLVEKVRASLQPGARWAWADFAVPPRGWSRFRARGSLAVLYAFFRWQTGLAARALPPAEAILRRAGFQPDESRDFQGGLVRSAIFSRSSRDASRSAAATGKD
jgi:ubiquinone/menaquinone biosynthesis C-methylase UbiE